MPRAALKLRNKRLVRHVDPEDMRADHELSIDELIASKFAEVMQQAESLEDAKMRDLWMDAINTFVHSGDAASLIDICKWRRPIVPIDEFVFGETYLHQRKGELFPSVMDALNDLDTDQFDQAVLMGSLGCGKTTLANLSTIRDIYKVSCMRNPHATYGIQTGTQIGFTIQSIRLNTAKKVVFNELGRYIRNSPYFKNKFPYDPYVTTELKFKQFNMSVMPISSSTTAVISMNVLGGQLDEMNFMQKIERSKSQHADEEGSFDQAKQMFNTLANRRKSRFIKRGDLPGILFVISSSRFPDDFTEQQAKLSSMRGGNDDRIYVYHHSRWSAAPEQFGTETFQVQIGNSTYPSRVLAQGESPDPECDTLDVPIEFREEFERDTEGNLRDLGGVTTLSTHPYITQRQYIRKAMDAAFANGYQPIIGLEQVELSTGLPVPNVDRLRLDVPSDRHCHIDLGLTKDACGVAIGHIAGHKVTKTIDPITKREEVTVLPVIAYDLILRVIMPRGGEIQISDIRKLLIMLRDRYGLPIKWVTMDGFQSVDCRQILRKKGFLADYLSVEKAESWNTFKSALYGERILMPEHKFVAKELADLEQKVHNNKDKIDHRPNGTKDVADAVCGVANFLLSRKSSWSDIRELGATEGIFLLSHRESDYGAKPRGNYSPNSPQEELAASTNRKSTIRRKVLERRNINRK